MVLVDSRAAFSIPGPTIRISLTSYDRVGTALAQLKFMYVGVKK